VLIKGRGVNGGAGVIGPSMGGAGVAGRLVTTGGGGGGGAGAGAVATGTAGRFGTAMSFAHPTASASDSAIAGPSVRRSHDATLARRDD
jgi:hypothetical protein